MGRQTQQPKPSTRKPNPPIDRRTPSGQTLPY